MNSPDYFPFEYLTVAPTDFSIAEYCLAINTILLWGWSIDNMAWYMKPGETPLQMIVRVISHEEMHRAIYLTEGYHATFQYDNITETDMAGVV